MTAARRLGLVALTVPLSLAMWTGAGAQAPAESGGTFWPVQFSGEVGTSGELYSASGREARRPSSTGELYIRSTVTPFGRVTTGVDILFSTEDGAGLSATPGVQRQRLNRLGISPEWSWGQAHLGSFTDTYSSYTLSGLRVNGAGFALNPGLFRAASLFGSTDQAMLGGATDGSFRRRLAGGRVGIGRGSPGQLAETFVDVMLLRAWDDERSLPPGTDGLEPADGALPINTFAVTPQENVVGGLAGGLALMEGRLRLRGEATAALHSRDRRAPELDAERLSSYPGFLTRLITPRVSSHADYAYRVDARFRVPHLPGSTPRAPRTLDLSGDYAYIGPGYVSLGVASLPSDQRSVGLRSQVRFPRWTMGLNGRLQNDNLIGQKLATTNRRQLGTNVTFRPTPRWTAAVRGSFTGVRNNSPDSLRNVAYGSHTAGITNSFSLGGAGLLRSVSVTYGYQASGDDNPLRADAALSSHNADVRLGLSPSRALQISPSLGVVRARAGEQAWTTRESYALSVTTRQLEGRWTTTTAVGTSRAEPNRSTRASLNSQFRITPLRTVALGLRTSQFSSPLEDQVDFREYVVSLRMTQSFR